MSVHHHDFGGADAPPTTLANDTSPAITDLSAIVRAYRAIAFTTARIEERGRLLKLEERIARARYYDDRAAGCVALAKTNPVLLEQAGLNMLAANIMRAEVSG